MIDRTNGERAITAAAAAGASVAVGRVRSGTSRVSSLGLLIIFVRVLVRALGLFCSIKIDIISNKKRGASHGAAVLHIIKLLMSKVIAASKTVSEVRSDFSFEHSGLN